MRIIFLGPPGAGKGTQAQKIHQVTGVPILVMGDMLRESVRRGDPVGKEAEAFMKRGELVPDEVVIKVILARMANKDCQDKGFMLDGFPRTSAQAEALDKHLAANKISLDFVMYFSVPEKIVEARIAIRETCKQCGATFPGKEQFSCPKAVCSGEYLEKRTDDRPEVVNKRLQEYRQKTSPLLEYYRSKKMLIEISANRTIEEVFVDCMKTMQQFLPKK